MFSLEDTKTKKSNILDVKVKNYGECGYCAGHEEILNIPWNIWSQWLFISNQMGDKEWGAIFWVKNNTITSFEIPKQEVSSVDCEFKEELGGDGIIHSHHNMDAFHSRQDDTHARNLYTYSVVITNSKGNIATKRVKLPCNGFGYVEVKLQLIEVPGIDLSKITGKVREIISEISSEFEADTHPCEICQTNNCENCEYGMMPGLSELE
jgi:hypothetical protein